MTPSGRNKNIDTVLSLFDLKMEVSEREVEGEVDKSEANHTILQMHSIGLIKILDGLGEKTIMLNSFGIEVKQHGSWSKYLADKEDGKRLLAKQIKSSIRTNTTTIIILAITVIISTVSAYVSWLSYNVTKNNYKPPGTITDSLSNKLLERQNENSENLKENMKIDSLRITD